MDILKKKKDFLPTCKPDLESDFLEYSSRPPINLFYRPLLMRKTMDIRVTLYFLTEK